MLQRLLDAGASDAWLTPILMKKGRPAHTLHVLVGPNSVVQQQIRNIVLTETSAIGLRETRVAKTALARREYVVQLGDQQIRVKVALDEMHRVVNVQPEFDDVAAAAAALGRTGQAGPGRSRRRRADPRPGPASRRRPTRADRSGQDRDRGQRPGQRPPATARCPRAAPAR